MSNRLGIRVLHPGGYDATKILLDLCGVDSDCRVLDVACGVGTTSFYLAKTHQCEVDGVDISETLIEKAKRHQLETANTDRIRFTVADATRLPFLDNTFDVVVSQAFFILVDEKDNALSEITRVLKPGGRIGALEIGWYKTPSFSELDELKKNTCNDFIPRVVRFDEWKVFFESTCLNCTSMETRPMPSGMMQMVKAEGILNATRIMGKMMSDRATKHRMMAVQNTFEKYRDVLGYGLFCLAKSG